MIMLLFSDLISRHHVATLMFGTVCCLPGTSYTAYFTKYQEAGSGNQYEYCKYSLSMRFRNYRQFVFIHCILYIHTFTISALLFKLYPIKKIK